MGKCWLYTTVFNICLIISHFSFSNFPSIAYSIVIITFYILTFKESIVITHVTCIYICLEKLYVFWHDIYVSKLVSIVTQGLYVGDISTDSNKINHNKILIKNI